MGTRIFVVAVVVSAILLGWWVWTTRSATGPAGRIEGDVETTTDSNAAGEIAAAGDRMLGQAGNDPDAGHRTEPLPEDAAAEAAAERELAEIQRRLEEERRRLEELARQAEYAPLGESLHPLTAPDAEASDRALPGPDAAAPAAGPPPTLPAAADIVSGETVPDGELGLHAGTVIPAALITAIDSGLPGIVRAQVTAPVRDSATGTRVLIPPGALLVGTYDDNAAVQAERLFIYWRALQFPDGRTASLPGAPAADPGGISGIKGKRRSRFLRTLGAAFAINLVTALSAEEQTGEGRLADAIRSAAGSTAQTVTERMLERDLNASPTFRITAGTRMNVVLEEDLWLPPWT